MRSLRSTVYLILRAALWPCESTQPLTVMNTRNFPGGKARPARKADKLTTIREPIVQKMWARRLTTLWASTVRYKESSIVAEQTVVRMLGPVPLFFLIPFLFASCSNTLSK
jgi:hypothetical protein